MQATFLVMTGGAIGAALRYWLGRAAFVLAGPGWPWGTVAANLLGGFAMGLLAGWLVRVDGNEPVRLLLGVGVLGGFTTFSAFSLETMGMIERGDTATAALYVMVSVVGAIGALFLGLALTRAIA